MNGLGERIISTLNVSELMDALAEDLPQLGIRSGYVAIYENPPVYEFPQPLPPWSRLVLAYNEQGRMPLPQEGLRFPTHDILPQDVRASEHVRRMVVEALYFQREQIGFVVLGVGAQEGSTYGILRRYLSTSLQGALLLEELKKHEEHLEELVAIRTRELSTANEQLRREITDRKRVEESLREAETKFRSLVEQSLVGIYILQDQ